MRVSLFVLAAVLAAFPVVPASGESWQMDIEANLTLTQSAYSQNWVGGEAGSASWTLNSNWLAKKQVHPLARTKNTLKLAFGQTHSQATESRHWAGPVKSTDLIDLESVLHFTLGGFVDPFAAARVESQFFDNSDSEKDRYLNPVTLTESLGITKVFIKEEKREWSARLGAALRQHLNRDALNEVTLRREDEFSDDGGLEFVSDLKTPLAEDRITLSSKLIVFQALFYSKSDELKGLPEEGYWKSADVNWENIFTASVTKYLMVSLYVQFLYDKQVALGGRLKQSLSMGVTYKLM
ncbi:MAG: DUF3078 domain-containing protein [Candidatus Eiseniibacteriota bacterium]|nr:MAG: DUF3078 domain-containing protein [Candidatus Eisenbacteria bacterium]